MIDQMRKLAFGVERLQDGPNLSEIPQEFWWSLDEGHEALLRQLMSEGFKSTRMGSATGYVGEDREEVLEHEVHLLSSVLKHLVKYKLIVPLTDESSRVVFALAGGIVAPWGVVDKKDDRGQLRAEKRALMDHSDDSGGRRKNPHAKSTGTFSHRYSRQLATDKESLAALVLSEEDANPGYFVQVQKLDYSDAFPTNGERKEDVNDICASVRNLTIVYGSYTFGGREVPGIWEVMASAPPIAAMSMSWEDRESNGDTIPRSGRVVDDSVHAVARRGDRQERYISSFKNLMSWMAGSAANNTQKEEESGGFTFNQHGFGDLIDTARRGSYDADSQWRVYPGGRSTAVYTKRSSEGAEGGFSHG